MYYKKIQILFLVLSFSLPCLGYSQDTLEPIVFQSTPSYGATVTVIKSEDIENKSYTQVLEILKNEAGLDVINSGGLGQPTTVFIRGAKSEHTLVLIDGMEVNDPSTPARMFDFAQLSVENIERIEIYRGAQSARFGPDAIGGVINIISKKGDTPLQQNYSVEYGSFSTAQLQLDVAQKFKNFSYALSSSWLESEGFSAAETDSKESEKDGFKRQSLSFRTSWKPQKSTHLTTHLRYSSTNVDLDQSGGFNGDDPNFISQSEQVLTGVNLEHIFLEPHLKIQWSGHFLDQNRFFQNTPDLQNPTNYREDYQSQSFKLQNSYALSTAIGELELLLQYRQENASSEQSLDGTNSLWPKQSQKLFGQSLLFHKRWNQLWLQVGLRHDFLSYTQKATDWNYSINLEYILKNLDSKINFNLGSGVKPPSLFQLYSAFGSKDLRTESALSWDLSFEKVFFNSHHFIFTYFDQKFENLIDFDTLSSSYSNISQATTRGIELSTLHFLDSAWQWQNSYKLLFAKDEAQDTRLLRRPRHSLGSQIRWFREQFSLELGARFTDQRPDIAPLTFDPINLPSYFVLSAQGHYKLSSLWGLKARVENILNRQYQEIAGYSTADLSFHLGVYGKL